ncbi:MAG: altronate hydrolase [Saprospiraceae bacterium]|jgi:altronate hydrolase
MKNNILKIHPKDNVIVALRDLEAGETVRLDGRTYTLSEKIPGKHKFTTKNFEIGDAIIMYGVLIGKATRPIPEGCRISRENVVHAVDNFDKVERKLTWNIPDIVEFRDSTFNGYHRTDGKVGTMNYWLVVPLVFCENRNIEIIKASMMEQLGYTFEKDYVVDTHRLVRLYQSGADKEVLLKENILKDAAAIKHNRVFPNVDGIKFLSHDGGCGGMPQDSEALCRLIAGYILHPNVAGATVLSLGCQHAQFKILEKAIDDISGDFKKPLFVLEQQKSKSERAFIAEAVKKTFVGLMEANEIERKPAALGHLSLGLECGGSDGFSGISANPVLGYTSDLLVALGGTTMLSEFPELNGVERELIARCENDTLAEKFSNLMTAYSNRAVESGAGFDMNPSPGNIKDGLITDAMKSAGAAKKGGTSPVRGVLDYTEIATKKGLNLLCTPGNDVESTTGLAGSGANVILFTTGLGTPTGNPIVPVIKVATNNALAERMGDIVDFNTGTIITGEDTIESKGRALLKYVIQVANGEAIPAAVRLGQDDFIPWKRGISL